MIAALYVMENGPYYGIPDVDPWPESRDARLYDGPWPVVAHPPCARWCRLAGLVEHRYGIPRHEDGGVFAAALSAVRRFGGVLEHPAWSDAFPRFDLPRPFRGSWQHELFGPGWVTEVSQCAYGHRARKRTWLYAVVPDPPALDWSEPEEVIVARASEAHGEERRGNRLGKKEHNATPEPFRDLLLSIARSALTRPPSPLILP